MDALPNTTVTLLRTLGDIDEYTGEHPTDDSVTGVTAALSEESRTVRDPVTGDPRVVRHTMIRLPAGTAVTNDDRLRDEADNTVYAIQEVRQHRLAGRVGDLICQTVRMDNKQP